MGYLGLPMMMFASGKPMNEPKQTNIANPEVAGEQPWSVAVKHGEFRRNIRISQQFVKNTKDLRFCCQNSFAPVFL